MSKIFTGNIALASAIRPTGAQPLDDRTVVQSLDDLYSSLGTAVYNGMVVYVVDETSLYILVDKSKIDTPDGWKKVDGSGNGTITAESYTKACDLATADNLGQIIYVTAEETSGDTTYTAGPYIVTGEGTISKIGTTSASGDISGDVEQLKADVSGLKTTVGDGSSGLVADVTGLKTDVSDLKTDVSGLQAKVSNLETSNNGLVADVNGLKDTVGDSSKGLVADVTGLKSDVSSLQVKVSSLETSNNGLVADVNGLKSDVNNLKANVLKEATGVDAITASLTDSGDGKSLSVSLGLDNSGNVEFTQSSSGLKGNVIWSDFVV